jgi:hypothetical protein
VFLQFFYKHAIPLELGKKPGEKTVGAACAKALGKPSVSL